MRQPKNRSIAKMVRGLGCRSLFFKSQTPDTIVQTLENEIYQMRNGGGPLFCEFETYRWREHCGPNYDNHIGYRSEEEFKSWQTIDPLDNFENEFSEEQLSKLKSNIQMEIDTAFEFAENSKFPSPDSLKDYVFHD